MNRIEGVLLVIVGLALPLAVHADSASILAKARSADPARYQFAVDVGAEIRNTTDNKAFTLWWRPANTTPTAVIVTLHGHDAYATDGLYIWHPYAEQRGYAILALQWWFGGGETVADYYQPQDMYPLIAAILTEKGIKPGTVLFEGYSRGSTNTYAMAALDAYLGNHFIATTLSVSGGVATAYPPNQQIEAGAYGAKPFTGIQWIMYCGEKDPDPNLSGCPGMTAAKDWVTKYGATMKLFIDDPNGDHGGFGTNPANMNAALAAFAPLAPVTANPAAGIWWNPAEGGRGYVIETRNTTLFLGTFLYDGSGRPTWYAASGAMNGNTFNGALSTYASGQTLTGPYVAPIVTGSAGNVSITFTDSSHGALTWPGGTIPIQRFDIVTGGAAMTSPSGTPETGIWWNPAESGRGFALEIQAGTMFLGGYMFDASGNPIWYSSGQTPMTAAMTYVGTWDQYGNGQTMTGTYKPATRMNSNVGTVRIQFSDTQNATLTLPDGRQISITRFRF